MRIRIIFNLNNRGGAVAFHHQFLISELVHDLIADAPTEFSDYKLYNFSGLKGQTKVSKEGLHFYSSKVTLVISSLSEDFLRMLLQRLFQRKNLQIGQLDLVPDSVEREGTLQLKEDTTYIALSPLVVLSPEGLEPDEAKQFIIPTKDQFSDLVYESTMERMENSGIYNTSDISSFFNFQLLPDTGYLNKIRAADKKFARIYPVFNGHKQEVRGYTFPFQLLAPPPVHEFVFNCGLGAETSRGFGMLDIARSDPAQRSQPYDFK